MISLDGTTAVTGPPPKHYVFKPRMTGGSGSPLGYRDLLHTQTARELFAF
jgi:hypothetical protein